MPLRRGIPHNKNVIDLFYKVGSAVPCRGFHANACAFALNDGENGKGAFDFLYYDGEYGNCALDF